MPYIQGETLRQRLLRESQLPVPDGSGDRAPGRRRAVLRARQNVVHRDIKPENILLERDQVYVADFGIARAMEVAAG